MTDVENTFRAELNRMLAVDATPDWDAIVAAAGGGQRRRRRLGVAAAALLAATAVALVTPLGGAIARGLEEFSTWLTGEPGTPVSEEEQRAFDEENQQTWLGFPEGTKLRRLLTRSVGDVNVELLGFRSGASRLCLRLIVSGSETKKALECAPLDELRREGGPARVLIADEGVGRSDKVAWYGIDLVHTNKLRISAGIAADGVSGVVLRHGAGRHEVGVEANAFLYVAEDPDVGQFLSEVWARTGAGLVAVPFAPVPTLFGSPAGPAAPPAPAVEREVTGGSIGWLDDREERGEPLDVLPKGSLTPVSRQDERGEVVFGRVLTPDPDQPLRFVVTLNAHRAGGAVAGLCTWHLARAGSGGGGCTPYPGVFDRGPLTYGGSLGGPGAFANVHGFVSDDVARLEALLADRQVAEVPLADNFYAVDLPRANLPALLVAYDSEDRVIAVSHPLLGNPFSGHPVPARGKAELLWRETGPNGSYFELSVGASNQGGECQFLKHFIDDRHSGVSESCKGAQWEGPPMQVYSGIRYVNGRVRDDVKTVRIRFADGEALLLEPRRGYVLYAVPANRMTEARAPTAAEGLDAAGKVVGRASFEWHPPGPGG